MKRTRRVIQDSFPVGSIPRDELREAFRELRDKRTAAPWRRNGARPDRNARMVSGAGPLARRVKVAMEQETAD
jgi:hypothetical protein